MKGTNSTPNTIDHAGISLRLPPDVGLAIDEGDAQLKHMDTSKLDHTGSMVKLTRRQYEAMRRHIYESYSRG